MFLIDEKTAQCSVKIFMLTTPFDSYFLLLQQGFKGFQIAPDRHNSIVKFNFEGRDFELAHGSVVIAAITSCTNTSNPSVMLGAGKLICLMCSSFSMALDVCPKDTNNTDEIQHVQCWFCHLEC